MFSGVHHIGLQSNNPAQALAGWSRFMPLHLRADGDGVWGAGPNAYLHAVRGESPQEVAAVHATGLAHFCLQSQSAEAGRRRLEEGGVRLIADPVGLGTGFRYADARAFVGVPFWRWVAKRSSKHMALVWGMVIAIGTNLGLFALGRGDEMLFTAMFIVKGFCFGALDLPPAAMLADAADVDTAITRKARAGLLFALAGVVTSLGQAFGQGVSLNALAWVGYRAAGETSESALTALRVLYALAPRIVLGIALLIALRYGLDAQRHNRLREALSKRAQRALQTAGPGTGST